MQSVLSQEKLDVAKKNRSNLFNWRGQFTPQLVEYLLTNFSKPGDVVADPFAGSGTVLLESIGKDVSCYGFEINPAAYAMSRFYSISNLEQATRKEMLGHFEDKVLKLVRPLGLLPVFREGDNFRDQYLNLIKLTGDLLASLETKTERVLALNMLFICEGHKNYNLESSVFTSLSHIKKFALLLPFTPQPISAHLGDARTVHLRCNARPNLIITSPPYINVFNYHQNHRAILEAAGWNMLAVARSEFGANRKHRGNRFKTVVQYCLDMEQALCSFWQCLQDNGLVIIIIGRESNVRGAPFYNGKIAKGILESMGGFESVSDYERTFTNKFGEKIKEDIIIYQKKACPPNASVGKEVAVKHLKVALKSASQSAKGDINDAISEADSITQSPLFALKDAFPDAQNSSQR